MKKQLTAAVIRAATCSGKTREFIYDTVSTGLVLYVTPAGSRSFYAHYPSPVTSTEGRLKLGNWKQFDRQTGLTLEEAREASRVCEACAVNVVKLRCAAYPRPIGGHRPASTACHAR
jgi:Arm domain-containing DNA-binding protein